MIRARIRVDGRLGGGSAGAFGGANGGLRWALGDKMRTEDAARGVRGPGVNCGGMLGHAGH